MPFITCRCYYLPQPSTFQLPHTHRRSDSIRRFTILNHDKQRRMSKTQNSVQTKQEDAKSINATANPTILGCGSPRIYDQILLIDQFQEFIGPTISTVAYPKQERPPSPLNYRLKVEASTHDSTLFKLVTTRSFK